MQMLADAVGKDYFIDNVTSLLDNIKEILNKYNNLIKEFNNLFIHLIHRAYGHENYYDFALNSTTQTFKNRGINNFDVSTILGINYLYIGMFEHIMLERFVNVKSMILTSDYYQYTVNLILENFKDGGK